ncbi:ExbD/TolR family protein [Rhodopirellula bahusiensis]|uniref:Biopolymer transporter ExbD n=1 Tax=Rhodopirellula bahusiensis TaxID=2014065 RepID=A0A2G1VYT1_9BACT|nr:biopolymer transporter ExbD [Rhodopirellula bahusiensis]PHQ31927.1 biopolymer transporter ExbD [Rhodopirellula bahusiensis]
MKRNRGTEDATINLTPMIDVVFLLVIFFMVSSKMDSSDSGVQVNVASADMQSMARTPDQRIVEVRNDGSLLLDGTPMSSEQLTKTLKQQRSVYPGLQVSVRGDSDSSLHHVVKVMRQIELAGVQKMGVSERR